MKTFVPVLISLLLFTALKADAQRRGTTYESLLQRSEQPSTYIDHIALPGEDGRYQAAVFFRLDYDFIPFLRKRANMTPPNPEEEYFGPIRMGLELYEGAAPGERRSRQARSPLLRETWNDTIWVPTFEMTQSNFDHAQGVITATLDPGEYHYTLQLGRGESTREVASRPRNFTVPDLSESERGAVILLSELQNNSDKLSGTLLNYGNNVLYGQDYHLLILLPAKEELTESSFTLQIHRLESGSDRPAEQEPRFSEEISAEKMFRGYSESISRQDQTVQMTLASSDEGYTYAHAFVPNHEFENARYRIRLMADGSETPVAERIVHSRWIDMPVSLYNLDVAIEMMRFIVSDDQLRRLNSGSSAERERKFREFWAERDPTPDSEYNELMAEYFRRVDYAYQNFSSLQNPGYETDQGQAYILYGPPANVERRLLRNQPTREVWEYPDRTLIFEATTGFGDFRLVSES